MKFQRINFLKPAVLICISIIILWTMFGYFKASDSLPQDIEINENLISHANNAVRDSIVNYGMELLGTPYVAAGSDKNGFDCSGFIYFVFQHFKIEVPRSSPQYQNFGEEVPIENVKKGDVLVFLSPSSDAIGHLGIVTNAKGKASEFIHSTSGREMKVVITSLTVEGYKRRFVKAVSVVN